MISVIISVVFFAEATSVFISSIAPIATGIIGAVFTYLGLRLNNKAKSGDQNIASQAQQYEGIAMAQQFMKDALDEAKVTIGELKLEIKSNKEEILEMRKSNDTLKASNDKLIKEIKKLTNIIKEKEGEDESEGEQ